MTPTSLASGAAPLSVLELPRAFGGGAIAAGRHSDGGITVGDVAARNIATFDALDFDVFRAMPAVTLVSGYLLPFFEWNLWGHRWTTVLVLVALNQPFTLWLLHSFFLSIPRDLDESALVDGCTRFQAFRLAIMPVMWPGVITTGIFSFLVGYSDFVISASLLSEDNKTMVPAIGGFLGTTQQPGRLMLAVAATVSAILPLMILVTFSQRRIVGGLTAGAVKG